MSKVIWVLETNRPADIGSVAVSLYESETDACREAAQCALDYMDCMDANDPNDPDVFPIYQKIMGAFRQGDYQSVVSEFTDWNNDQADYEELYLITVYQCSVVPASKPAVKPASGKPSVEKPTFGSMNDLLQKRAKDVPCKVCGRNVNASEDTCWFCGVGNPAKG